MLFANADSFFHGFGVAPAFVVCLEFEEDQFIPFGFFPVPTDAKELCSFNALER